MKQILSDAWAKYLALAAIVLSVFAVVLVVVFAIPAYQRTEKAARDGAAAKKRQVYVAPTQCLVYQDAYVRGVFGPRDFDRITDMANGFPVVCERPLVP